MLGCTVQAQEIKKWKITDVEKLIAASDSEVLVINFWATFCKPCVAEIPFFIQITNSHAKDDVKLFLVSVDLPAYYPAKIVNFAKEHGFNARISWLQETNADYFCPKIDSAWSGSIPATLIINNRTGYRKFIEGELSAKLFAKYINEALQVPAKGAAAVSAEVN